MHPLATRAATCAHAAPLRDLTDIPQLRCRSVTVGKGDAGQDSTDSVGDLRKIAINCGKIVAKILALPLDTPYNG